MSVTQELAKRIRAFPDRPGIYVFRDAEGKPLYIGKAKSLHRRVSSYLRDPRDSRLEAMLQEAAGVECVLTDTDAEALLLENNWIKNQRPRYNILLRDDKTYPYLKLTVREDYPRIVFTRRIRSDGAAYFGPFLPGGLARKAIKLVQKLFQVRVCRIPIDGSLARPCLYYDMRRCLGPCVAGLTTQRRYQEAVAEARLFLEGRTEPLLRRLRRDMGAAAEALDFERAAQLRDTIVEVQAIGPQQKIDSLRGEDVDVFGIQVAGGNAAVSILVMRGGQVLDRRELFWEGQGGISPQRLLSELLPQIYQHTTFVPKEIHLPIQVDGGKALQSWLSERKGQRVYLRLPARGPKARRVALATRNARLAHRRRFRGQELYRPAVGELMKHLALPERPRRIEGFDISHLQGAQTVASLVVWEEGRMCKQEYRTFNIRDVHPSDDLGALREAVTRRYRRILEETGAMPDLVLVDGGRGQLNSALAALAELGVEETPVVALAKRDEEIYFPARPEPLGLPRRNPGLRLLQEIRDEAHRFALSCHRQRRTAGLLRSRLESLDGVGPRRKRLLLRRFGSLAGVRRASLEELQGVLGPILGARIHEQLRAGSQGTARETTEGVTAGEVAGKD